MSRSFIPITTCVLVVVVFVGFVGCGSDDPTEPIPDQGPVWPENETSLPTEDAAALTDATNRWEILRLGKDLAGARTVLVAELNDTWPEVQNAEITDDGEGFSIDEFGEQTSMTMATGGGNYYLPANIHFEIPEDCRPSGVHSYQVQIHYPSCPEQDGYASLYPESINPEWDLLNGLLPTGAEIYFEAMDEDRQVLETGLWNHDLTSGRNSVEICPCDADLDLMPSRIPGPRTSTCR